MPISLTSAVHNSRSQPFRWQRRSHVVIRSGIGAEGAIAAAGAWMRPQILGPTDPTRAEIIFVDGQIMGRTSVMHGDGLIPDPQGAWALSGGLLLDRRLQLGLGTQEYVTFLEKVGPFWLSLYARRYGLRGYIASIPLHSALFFAPSYRTPALVQQIEAGSVIEPALTAFYRAGAQTLDIIDALESAPAQVVVRWHNRR